MDDEGKCLGEETAKIKERYKYRSVDARIYHPLDPQVFYTRQERERALLHFFRKRCLVPGEKTIVEVGCGSGTKLLELVLLGFEPKNITGIDLLSDRVERAKLILPASARIIQGDAANTEMEENGYDIVYQSMVFTSILDRSFKAKLAKNMWDLVKPGGAVLWYDFTVNNPKNPDVSGVSIQEIRDLFPDGNVSSKRITLAPPIGRLITKLHPSLYSLFNSLPFLRTHLLCWIQKDKK